MKKLFLYIGFTLTFLLLVFALNGVYVTMHENSQTSEIDKQNSDSNNNYSFSSHLPLITIETGGQKISKDEEIYVEISVFDSSLNSLNNTPDITAIAGIKYRGNSSYYTFDKKQYRIEFKQEFGNDKNKAYSILDMPEATDWVLNGPFLDRSLLRNYLGYHVSRELLPWASATRYCEVFIDGEYMGLYLMIEPITNEIGRLGLSDYSLISGRCSYVVKMDRAGEEENALKTYGVINCLINNDISVSYPTPSNLTDNQKEYITNDISEFEKVLCSDYFDDPEIGYAKYIDVASFVDYFIISEMMLVTDAGHLSTYFYSDLNPNSKLTIATWDFNNSYDNIPWDIKSFEEFYLVEGNWFKRLVQDRNFVRKIASRYYELRKSTLSDETLLGMIDDNINYLGDSIDRNFEVWGYTFNEQLLSADRDPSSFEEAISMLSEAIVKRGKFLDENIESLYDYCIN